MVTIHSELRVNENNEPEVWANLGDILDWLDTLPEHTEHRVAADVAHEIREMLFRSVADAKVLRSES